MPLNRQNRILLEILCCLVNNKIVGAQSVPLPSTMLEKIIDLFAEYAISSKISMLGIVC